MTMMIYLEQPISGGHSACPAGRVAVVQHCIVLTVACSSLRCAVATLAHFPRARGAERDGIKIAPLKGRAVLFRNVRGGVEDEASLHEACPVLAGEKHVATLWLAQRK